MLNLIIVLIGILVTGTQTALIFFGEQAICFNEGCAVVESFTKVPPVIFNLAGCLYFLLIFYTFCRARSGSDGWRQLASLLLLAGMAAEGVLVAFQYYIVDIFCSYCLIICSLVFALNLIAGLKQFCRGIVAFVAVLVAFSVLQFSSPGGNISLEGGVYARLAGDSGAKKMYLFFSETCPHCEEVIATINESNTCEIAFNPVGVITDFPLENAVVKDGYRAEGNVAFLASLGIREIPVLVITGPGGAEVLKGKNRIDDYLDKNCRGQFSGESSALESRMSSVLSDGETDFLFLEEEQNCEVNTNVDCNDLNKNGEN
ncbi:vitamin K epoxide reductase family protein [Desulfotalea psychrophila]|uniref:Vitamin K epoxide reductase domain-containing protein n=1 Tax=Desulfotalea psychrophila (strain LSv54 / DSM 12343) TaxID=177439 RepID=Q6AQC3_DESPS|nr:vitamin K epoxide reductase family protein [Desulfotalea psychrophila]CAG35450.1 unknown protein [Desulfotalea psychrophila LSv54]